MGLCPSFSPEERVLKNKNQKLLVILKQELQSVTTNYQFTKPLLKSISDLEDRYLLNYGILEDIDRLVFHVREDAESIKSEDTIFENFDQEVRESCLILEDEGAQLAQKDGMMSEEEKMNQSFKKNIDNYASLVAQINIIYQRDFDKKVYRKSLQFFLKWTNVFQQHSFGGFLKPIYRQFCQSLYSTSLDEVETVLDETRGFVMYMVKVYTKIYQLADLCQSSKGHLFKNENVYNLIMSFLFRRTKIRKFVKQLVYNADLTKIERLKKKLEEHHSKPPQYFGVGGKFTLMGSECKTSLNAALDLGENPPYYACMKKMDELCEDGQTPITKLKLIVSISKEIMIEITNFYKQLNKQPPELDPDNLTSIIIYLIARTNNFHLYEELKLVEYFTTTNCLNSISGFYLNTFNAAIESILSQ